MSYEFDTSATVFDRRDLKTLQSSYARALGRLEVSRIMDAVARDELAKLVFHLGRERILEGTGLRYKGADEGIAEEASDFLSEHHAIALVA